MYLLLTYVIGAIYSNNIYVCNYSINNSGFLISTCNSISCRYVAAWYVIHPSRTVALLIITKIK